VSTNCVARQDILFGRMYSIIMLLSLYRYRILVLLLLTRSDCELLFIVLIVRTFTFLKYLIAFRTGSPVSAYRHRCSIILVYFILFIK